MNNFKLVLCIETGKIGSKDKILLRSTPLLRKFYPRLSIKFIAKLEILAKVQAKVQAKMWEKVYKNGIILICNIRERYKNAMRMGTKD